MILVLAFGLYHRITLYNQKPKAKATSTYLDAFLAYKSKSKKPEISLTKQAVQYYILDEIH